MQATLRSLSRVVDLPLLSETRTRDDTASEQDLEPTVKEDTLRGGATLQASAGSTRRAPIVQMGKARSWKENGPARGHLGESGDHSVVRIYTTDPKLLRTP